MKSPFLSVCYIHDFIQKATTALQKPEGEVMDTTPKFFTLQAYNERSWAFSAT